MKKTLLVEFLVADGGTAGLVEARMHRPDLVVTDVKRAGLDGFQLRPAFRGDPAIAGTRVALVTPLDDETSRKKGRLVGATAFMTKPVKAPALRAPVSSLLGIAMP
jgi:twitching motility two-component system response regulator PilG